jgi:hypothetical protein
MTYLGGYRLLPPPIGVEIGIKIRVLSNAVNS